MIRFTDQAATEVSEARAWYQRRQRDLGRQFTSAIRATLARVEDLPETYPPVRGAPHRALVRPFPYALYHQIDGFDIVACVHTARHPRQERLD